MKKILIIALTLMVIITTAIPAYAVTPPMRVPDMPEIPAIEPDFSYINFDAIFEKWFEDHPIRIKSVRLG